MRIALVASLIGDCLVGVSVFVSKPQDYLDHLEKVIGRNRPNFEVQSRCDIDLIGDEDVLHFFYCNPLLGCFLQ